MARLKLRLYSSVIPDCRASLNLMAQNMKAYYYLAQAELELGDLDAAYDHSRMAYELCSGVRMVPTGTGDGKMKMVVGEKGSVEKGWEKSMGVVGALVLRCKKELWEKRESARLATRQGLLPQLHTLLSRERDAELSKSDNEADKEDIRRSYKAKQEELEKVWESSAAGEEDRRRTVPDWAIDDITFAVMQDPVVTKTGHSYERASITEHLRRSPTDPMTREPLTVEELRPNLGLRGACEEFLRENGWAVDW
jgi:STIP1 family protein 1